MPSVFSVVRFPKIPKNCQAPAPKTEVITPDSKDLPRQSHPRYLACFIAQLGILKIGVKKEIPRKSREKKAARARTFSFGEDPITVTDHANPMFFRIQCVPATPAESNGSAQALLSILSTPPNSNDFKQMQNTTQAKNHNFPKHCLKTGAKRANRPANPSGAEFRFPTGEALCALCVLRDEPSYSRNQIKYEPATPAKSDRSSPDPVVNLVNTTQVQ